MRIPTVLALGLVLLQACSASVGASSDNDAEQPQTIAPEVTTPPPKPEPEPEPEPPPPVIQRPETPDALPSEPPRRFDATAVALWSTGGVATIVGAVLIGTASARASGAPMGSHEQWVQERTGAQLQQRVGFAVLGVGGALLTGAVIRTVIIQRRRAQPGRVRAGL